MRVSRLTETNDMINDLNEREISGTVKTDLCLIGAGAAGITIAREMVGGHIDVFLVESGSLNFEAATQALYQGESVGRHVWLETGRLRMFGGSTNHWTGRCAALDPIDFAVREWVPQSGWPIDRHDLDSFYLRARAACGFKLDWTADEETRRRIGAVIPPFESPWFHAFLWHFATSGYGGFWNWGTAYRDLLRQAQNIHVLLHANLTSMEVHQDGKEVAAVVVQSLKGRSLRIEAKAFVLCCGGIENARMLLICAERNPSINPHDVVGRYFQQHPRGRSAILVTSEATSDIQNVFNIFSVPGDAPCEIGLALSERAQCKHRLLNCSAVLRYEGDPASGWEAAKNIFGELTVGRWAPDIGEKVWDMISDLGSIVQNAERRFVGRQSIQRLKSADILLDLEQAPNPDSRITLSSRQDVLGLSEARADWRLTSLEQRTAKAFTMFIASEFARLGIGRSRLEPWVEETAIIGEDAVTETLHHIGTTRMSANPRFGVVDGDCRVHNIENLYVAGSSVFPTGGHANPTLTIVALAIRLADHLKNRLS
jgi:choline dehydrogenase-like flavoprotein